MERKCEECAVCCYICEIREINKPPHTNCFYQLKEDVKNRCLVYDAKPKDCQAFACSWLQGFGSEQDRPDINGVMISACKFNNGTWLFIIETVKNAVLTTAKDMIIQMVNQFDFPAIVSDYESKPPDDKGDYTIIKESLLPRCKRMAGDLIEYLDSDKRIGLYKLRK